MPTRASVCHSVRNIRICPPWTPTPSTETSVSHPFTQAPHKPQHTKNTHLSPEKTQEQVSVKIKHNKKFPSTPPKQKYQTTLWHKLQIYLPFFFSKSVPRNSLIPTSPKRPPLNLFVLPHQPFQLRLQLPNPHILLRHLILQVIILLTERVVRVLVLQGGKKNRNHIRHPIHENGNGEVKIPYTSFSVVGPFTSTASGGGALVTNSFAGAAVKPASKLINFGGAVLPAKNSSIVRAGSGPTVSG